MRMNESLSATGWPLKATIMSSALSFVPSAGEFFSIASILAPPSFTPAAARSRSVGSFTVTPR